MEISISQPGLVRVVRSGVVIFVSSGASLAGVSRHDCATIAERDLLADYYRVCGFSVTLRGDLRAVVSK